MTPGGTSSWDELLVLARLHRTAFEHLNVCARPKITGQRGIHVWVPITPGPSFDQTRAWVEQLSKTVGTVVPDLVRWKWQVHDRAGLARLDYTQNSTNQTLAAPYSPRAAAGAPVSAPIRWDELDSPTRSPDGFTIRSILPRMAEKGDLFADVLRLAQRLLPWASLSTLQPPESAPSRER